MASVNFPALLVYQNRPETARQIPPHEFEGDPTNRCDYNFANILAPAAAITKPLTRKEYQQLHPIEAVVAEKAKAILPTDDSSTESSLSPVKGKRGREWEQKEKEAKRIRIDLSQEKPNFIDLTQEPEIVCIDLTCEDKMEIDTPPSFFSQFHVHSLIREEAGSLQDDMTDLTVALQTLQQYQQSGHRDPQFLGDVSQYIADIAQKLASRPF